MRDQVQDSPLPVGHLHLPSVFLAVVLPFADKSVRQLIEMIDQGVPDLLRLPEGLLERRVVGRVGAGARAGCHMLMSASRQYTRRPPMTAVIPPSAMAPL